MRLLRIITRYRCVSVVTGEVRWGMAVTDTSGPRDTELYMHRGARVMGGTRNLKLGATQRGGKGQGTGGNGNRRVGPVGQMSTRVGIGGGGSRRFEPPTPVHVYMRSFWAKIGFKFWTMVKISNISTSEFAGSFHNYYIRKLFSSHLDKCIVTLGHSIGLAQPTFRLGATRGQGHREAAAPAPPWRRPCCAKTTTGIVERMEGKAGVESDGESCTPLSSPGSASCGHGWGGRSGSDSSILSGQFFEISQRLSGFTFS